MLSVCNNTCPVGYEASSSCDSCTLADICEAEQPCSNGGTCLLDYPPADYYCECTDNFNGTNCMGEFDNVNKTSIIMVMYYSIRTVL